MSQTIIDYDYCMIDHTIVSDWSSSVYGGSATQWMTFHARATGPSGTYLAGQSPKIPIPNIASQSLVPNKRNSSHAQTVETLVNQLRLDGWFLLKDKTGNWWQLRFRRPTSERKSLWQKVKAVFSIEKVGKISAETTTT